MQGLGGRCLDHSTIPEIIYHAALVEMPGRVVQQFLAEIEKGNYPPLLRSQGVMFFRARAQSAFGLRPVEQVPFDLVERLREQGIAAGAPIVAVLDGLPLENHASLAGRIFVDDPDDHASLYEVSQQQHGTAMASLVVHGDLHGDGPALRRQVYIRPIFIPDSLQGIREVTPANRLLVDLIHRAVRRLFEGDGEQPPIAPTVQIISLSVGDPHQPFDREMSPLARLIDWLAWEYKVLIIVSIGNRYLPITLDANWRELSDDELGRPSCAVCRASNTNGGLFRPLRQSTAFLLVRYMLTRARCMTPAPGLISLVSGKVLCKNR